MDYEDPEKHCDDCVDTIRQQNQVRKMKALIRAIKQAEAKGDKAELSRAHGRAGTS